MFDIAYLGRRCFRFIRGYPRTWTIVGFLLILGIGIRLGQTGAVNKITDYFRSFTDREQTDVTKSVVRGITHRQIQDKGMLTNILSVSPDAVDIRPYRALSTGIGTETLVSLARRHKALAAINGGFFEMAGTFRGESVGALKIDGEWRSEPEQGRAVIGLRTVDGTIEASIDRIALRLELVLQNGKIVPIDGMNRSRGRNELVIYRPHFHVVTLTMPDGVEAVVRNGEVVGIHNGQGSLRIPADGYVLSASGKKARVNFYHISLKVIRSRFMRQSSLNVSGTASYGQVSHILSAVVHYYYRMASHFLRKRMNKKALIGRFTVSGIHGQPSVKRRTGRFSL